MKNEIKIQCKPDNSIGMDLFALYAVLHTGWYIESYNKNNYYSSGECTQ